VRRRLSEAARKVNDRELNDFEIYVNELLEFFKEVVVPGSVAFPE
jgi:hypothetical protein